MRPFYFTVTIRAGAVPVEDARLSLEQGDLLREPRSRDQGVCPSSGESLRSAGEHGAANDMFVCCGPRPRRWRYSSASAAFALHRAIHRANLPQPR